MDKKKKYIIIIAVVFLLLFSLFFLQSKDKEVDVVLDERREELEEMKDKEFYQDPILRHLGWTKEEVLEAYGSPDENIIHYLGGRELYYEEMAINFVLSGEEGVVNNFYLYPGAEIFGIRIGMTFDEIESILGEPTFRGHNSLDGGYVMNYFLGDQTGDVGEVELWIDAGDEEEVSHKADVLWKKYWESI